ncbi:hypothetical protein BKA80DRAFT_345089 [Phyllosticta citrichinensis]
MRSVASTTLLTFRVDVPSDAFSVELRGSWDNFNHSYHLQQDPRRSSTNWVGIFTFKDIICDGDSDSAAEKREGCLRMGGTYWYHYVVNGVYEFCDEAQPSTTRCPFLPGEDLNILHVPCEEAADVLQDGFPELSADTPAFTWNPQARYSTPRPNKFEALARKAQPPPPSPSYPSPVTPSCENPASFDFFPAQDFKRPSAGSIRKSPDGNDRPPSRNPSAQSDSRPWTSSDDNSMKSPRVRGKTKEKEEFHGFSGVVWQPQQEETTGRQHDATPQYRSLYPERRSSQGRPTMYPPPSGFEDPTAYAFDDFLYDPWGGVGNYEVQDSNPGLDYAYSDDAYDDSDQFNGYSSEHDSAHIWEPDHWPLQNMIANMAPMPSVHTINTESSSQSSVEGDSGACLDEEDVENAGSEETFPAQALPDQESYPERSPEAEDIQQESPPSDDDSWTSAASNHNGPLRRFRSIIERYRNSSSSPGSIRTEDGTRENNPSTPTQDSGFLGYMLPEEESTSQVTLTKVSTQATVVRKNSLSNAPQLELNLDGGQLGDWSSVTSLGELENFSF